MQRYRGYGPWLKEKFGTTVYKLSVDGGFTCPNRDGTAAWGGCTYCNNDSFRPHGAGAEKSIEHQIQEGVLFLSRRFNAKKFLVYWQNFSNTYAPVAELGKIYQESLAADPRIVGITVGTRPDCVEEEKLELFSSLAQHYYVCLEYGLESTNDETLRKINRGHDFACFVDAVFRTERRGLDICAHAIIGFPGETRSNWLSYAATLNELPVKFLKLHHLHIVEGTPMAREFRHSPFPVFQLSDWVEFVCDFLERLDPEKVIQRLFGWAPDADLIAPSWGKSKAEILLLIHEELEKRDSWQGKVLGASRPK